MLEEEELAVADPGQAGAEPAGVAAVVFGLHRRLIHLPFLAEGRVGQQVVEALVGVLVLAERAAELDVLGVAPVGGLDEQVGLADGERLRVDFLAEQVNVGVGVDLLDALSCDGQHAARAAAAVVDGADDVFLGQGFPVAGEQQVDHEANDFAGREVLAGVLVHRLAELADQLLEDVTHLQVRHAVGVEVDVLEPLGGQEEQAGLFELGDGVVEVELLDDLAHVVGKGVDVVLQVGGEVLGVAAQGLEGVGGRVVEREARRLAELRGEVFELPLEPGVGGEDGRLGRLQHAVDAAKDGERQDDVGVLRPAERIPQQVGHGPDERHLVAEVVHGRMVVLNERFVGYSSWHPRRRRRGGASLAGRIGGGRFERSPYRIMSERPRRAPGFRKE